MAVGVAAAVAAGRGHATTARHDTVNPAPLITGAARPPVTAPVR
jgi:hypothetical protein